MTKFQGHKILQEFIYADDLKELFRCMGNFYSLSLNGQSFPCRSSLEILAINEDFGKQMIENSPDALVVMMNPGSSRPINHDYEEKSYHVDNLERLINYREFVPTRPDNSQYQIMRLMVGQGWKHVRILNLSDLRSGNSGQFKKMFISAAESDASHPHSIFHSDRRQELFGLTYMEEPAVIFAWGKTTFLSEFATEAISIFHIYPRLCGIKVKGDSVSYYHANQRTPDRLRGWLSKIEMQLNTKSE